VFKKLFRIIYYVFLGSLACVALLLIFSRFPIAGKWQTLMVLSGSMEPKIKTGSIVLVKGASTYKPGDVVTFKGEGKTPTTHRIVAETQEGFVTRGDANNADDFKKVQPQNILGKALFSIPYLGYLIAWAKTTAGLICLIVIPAVIIIYSEALAIQKELKKIIKARQEKQIPQTAAVATDNAAMPIPKIKNAKITPLASQDAPLAKTKKIAKKTLKASILIFGFLSILNLRAIQGTKAFFADEEKSSGQITAWIDAPTPEPPAPPAPGDVVINEFLPNPEGLEYGFNFGDDSSNMPQGEWVELYNNSDNSFDLAGWYIRDESATNKIIITAANTNPAGTVINGKSWLVVYINKAVLNNTSDTVKLFDDADNLIDLYTYTTTNDYCDLEPTPGASNTNIPSGACSGVPPNKSYARIPDGSANWVDPIPTPGAPNILEEKNNTPNEKTAPTQDDSNNNDTAPAAPETTLGDASNSTAENDILENGDSTPAITEENATPGDDINVEDENTIDNPPPVITTEEENFENTQNQDNADNPPTIENEEETAITDPEADADAPPAENAGAGDNNEQVAEEEDTAPPEDNSPPPLAEELVNPL